MGERGVFVGARGECRGGAMGECGLWGVKEEHLVDVGCL